MIQLERRKRWWNHGWVDPAMAGLVFSLSLGVYVATLSPGLSYASPDGNELITVCAILGLAHSTGYPLYTWLGKLFTLVPIGTVAYRVNLMSAVLGAGGTALVYGIVLQITEIRRRDRPSRTWGGRLAALFAALLFAFARTFWSQTTIAEVYAPNLFMVALTLFLLLSWARREREGSPHSGRYLVLTTLSLGLSVGTHMSNLGFVPACALFILMVAPQVLRRPRLILGAALAFVVGCLQFLWLPYKAHTLNDALLLRDAPFTWQSFYNYTLGAFPQMKFAFSLPEIPERIVLYLDLLRQNVGSVGILLGLYGLVELLLRRTAHFFLLMTMYLTHVAFFIQYRVFDLDVFFIPAHFLYVVAIGYGAACGLARLRQWNGRRWPQWAGATLATMTAVLLVGLPIWQATGNYAHNDRSGDTAIEDFYQNVFELLPTGSVLLGQGGVFGYDMFYYPLVEGVRPDVFIPLLAGPRVRPEQVRGQEIYSTSRADEAGRSGPWGIPAGLIPAEAWYVPLLVGESDSQQGGILRGELVLYRVSTTAPELVVEQAHPDTTVAADLGGLRLEGFDLETTQLEAGAALHLTLYWRTSGRFVGLVNTALGEDTLEAHALGFGNLERYLQEIQPPANGVIVEDFLVVIPSDTPAGPWPLRVGLVVPHPLQEGQPAPEAWVELGTITVLAPGG